MEQLFLDFPATTVPETPAPPKETYKERKSGTQTELKVLFMSLQVIAPQIKFFSHFCPAISIVGINSICPPIQPQPQDSLAHWSTATTTWNPL